MEGRASVVFTRYCCAKRVLECMGLLNCAMQYWAVRKLVLKSILVWRVRHKSTWLVHCDCITEFSLSSFIINLNWVLT